VLAGVIVGGRSEVKCFRVDGHVLEDRLNDAYSRVEGSSRNVAAHDDQGG
jgi:hypothetical protein